MGLNQWVNAGVIRVFSVGQHRCLGVTALGFEFGGHFVTVEGVLVFYLRFG